MDDLVRFSYCNRKMKELATMLNVKPSSIVAFDLPAGYTCPSANLCLAKTDKQTGKLVKGPHCQFTCYATRAEFLYPNTRKMRWFNFDLLRKAKTTANMTALILQSIPKQARIIRIHSSGDFYNPAYFSAWIAVAKARPDVLFFGYTKVLDCMLLDHPANFHLVYSYGGKQDNQAANYNLPTCYVVRNEQEAQTLGVEIACTKDNPVNDFDYIVAGLSFAILLH